MLGFRETTKYGESARASNIGPCSARALRPGAEIGPIFFCDCLVTREAVAYHERRRFWSVTVVSEAAGLDPVQNGGAGGI